MKIEYINNPYLPVTVLVIGAGGNGTQMIQQLGRINYALRSLGRQGLQVYLMDDDIVSPSNIGRQLFAECEIGQFKSNVVITRINRFYGTQWESIPQRFSADCTFSPNVIITCTDNVASRLAVDKVVKQLSGSKKRNAQHEKFFHYWIDMGNLKDRGQVICGSPRYHMPTVIDMNPMAAELEEVDNTPSCSLAEALGKQDLFVNTFIADTAAKLLWEMLTTTESINWRGAYINTDTLNIKKIAA